MAEWGSTVEYGSSALALGYDYSIDGNKTTVNVYVWTKYSIQDTTNTFIVNFCGTTVYNGSVSILTYGNSDAWATSRIVKLWSGSTTASTWSVDASLTKIEAIGSSNVAYLRYRSGTTWTPIGTPGAINIEQNSDLSITISGAWPVDGINNSVKHCELYYKWNSSTIVWNDSDKYIKIEKADSNNNYSYKIPASDVLNGTHTSIAVVVYGIGSYGNTITSVKTSTVIQGGVITSVPYRYWLNNADTGEFVDGSVDNIVRWDKNGGGFFKLYLEYPIGGKMYQVYSGTDNYFNLSSSSMARAVGLMAMANGTNWYDNWYYNGTQPLSRYYDTNVILKSYKDSDSNYIGSNYHDLRIEMYLPQIPSGFSVAQIDGEDYAYESNKFKASWPVTSRCNQYIIRYAVNSPTNANSWTQCKEDIVINGHNTTNAIIEDDMTFEDTRISSLLAGQRMKFNIRGRCSLRTDYIIDNVTKTITYTYDSAEISSNEIQKQGGMVTYINNKYQNCHVCVVDNNGKIVKALAAYVYAYKDGSKTEKEWRLIKMQY